MPNSKQLGANQRDRRATIPMDDPLKLASFRTRPHLLRIGFVPSDANAGLPAFRQMPTPAFPRSLFAIAPFRVPDLGSFCFVQVLCSQLPNAKKWVRFVIFAEAPHATTTASGSGSFRHIGHRRPARCIYHLLRRVDGYPCFTMSL